MAKYDNDPDYPVLIMVLTVVLLALLAFITLTEDAHASEYFNDVAHPDSKGRLVEIGVNDREVKETWELTIIFQMRDNTFTESNFGGYYGTEDLCEANGNITTSSMERSDLYEAVEFTCQQIQ